MIRAVFFLSVLLSALLPGYGNEKGIKTMEAKTPKYLYKVLSVEDWQASSKYVKLSADDSAFIHFSTEDQLDRITTKYWADVPEYVVLKVDTAKLPGKMVFEANPGGTSKYYHLYNGSIPIDAVVEAKTIRQKSLL